MCSQMLAIAGRCSKLSSLVSPSRPASCRVLYLIIQIQYIFSVSHPQRALLTSHSQYLLIHNPGKVYLRDPQEEGHPFHPVHNVTLWWFVDFSSAQGGVSGAVTHCGWEQETARVSVSGGKALPPSPCICPLGMWE